MEEKKGYLLFKRVFDFTFVLFLLLILWPIMAIVAFCIKLEDFGGNVLFTQNRGGKNNSILRIYKFRTMIEAREINGRKLSDAERMLQTGKIIRKLSLDELPQLINILKGEMSFIGPRPLSVKFIPYYTQQELHRHDVLPGISGWAQVNGRNYLSWEDKFALDLFYVDHVSFALDFKIFFLTIKKIFFKPEVGVLGEDVAFKPIHLARQPRDKQ